MNALRYLCLLTSACAASAQPFRAAYQFPMGRAYSAVVDLPRYQIVDLGKHVVPIEVNDAGAVLLQADDNRLLLWRLGEVLVLHDTFVNGSRAFIDESGFVVAHPETIEPDKEILLWQPGTRVPSRLPFDPAFVNPPHYVELYALNDGKILVVRSDVESAPLMFPPYFMHSVTSRVDVRSQEWETLSLYEYRMEMDFSLHQGGMLYAVSDSNNYGDTVGHVYEDSTVTPPFASDPVFTFQNQYFAFNAGTVLDFEPQQVNDAGSILGRTMGPVHGLVILDAFGQRQLGPVISALDDTVPAMSNPADGFEEIVVGPHYLKRMTERNFGGHPTGQPSPDFWQGGLTDIISDTNGWASLHATCISANGRIAGHGLLFNPSSQEYENHAFLLLPAFLIPDWDRSGQIDPADRRLTAVGLPWRFWINDDDDSGDVVRSATDDLPGAAQPDWQSPGMDGLRDAVDFFPVLLDLQAILKSAGDPGQLVIRLRQSDAALNFMYSNLHPAEVGRLHDASLETGFGPDFSLPPGEAPTVPLGPVPVDLSPVFITNIIAENRGVLFFEATKASSQPLELEILRDGVSVLTEKLPISLGPVRDMFRILNLTQADSKFSSASTGPWPTDLTNPPNLPDAHLRQIQDPLRTFVHVHGYNWDSAEVPGAHAELFKRFFQTGSNARFIGVTWFGNQGQIGFIEATPDYNENVINALVTAPYLASALGPFAGETTSLFAHSLGNMVASSSIADHGLDVANFFMVNAAVPVEAYVGEQDDRRLMVHPDWKDEGAIGNDYPDYLLAAAWHRLFPSEDHRSLLTWKDRFANLAEATHCLNLYSSGEDVLAPGNGDLPSLLLDIWDQEHVWVYNEMVKGTTSIAASLTADVHGGWGFNRYYMEWVDPGGAAHPPPGSWVRMSPDEASFISPEASISEPFFRKFSTGDDDFPAWGTGDWMYEDTFSANARLAGQPFSEASPDNWKNHAKILGEAIPGHSQPTGSSPLPSLSLMQNIDVDSVFRRVGHWPDRSDPSKRDRWLHSDYLNPALSYVGNLYRLLTQQINQLP